MNKINILCNKETELLITPEESADLFNQTNFGLISFSKNFAESALNTESGHSLVTRNGTVWISGVLAFMFFAGRLQGIREERARHKERNAEDDRRRKENRGSVS